MTFYNINKIVLNRPACILIPVWIKNRNISWNVRWITYPFLKLIGVTTVKAWKWMWFHSTWNWACGYHFMPALTFIHFSKRCPNRLWWIHCHRTSLCGTNVVLVPRIVADPPFKNLNLAGLTTSRGGKCDSTNRSESRTVPIVKMYRRNSA